MRARTLIVAAFVTGLAAGCEGGGPAQSPVTGSFIATIGASNQLDTVAVEHYTLSNDSLMGESVVAYPRAVTRTYTASFGPNGQVQHIHIVTAPVGDSAASHVTTADFVYGPDSVTVDMKRDTLTRHYTVATNGKQALPFFEDLFAFWEHSVGRAMAGTADTATLDVLAGPQMGPVAFKRTSPTAADFSFPGWGTIHAQLTSDHRLASLDMTGTTSKYTVQRVPQVDVPAVARAWGARPQPGQLSPRDTASADIGQAHVVVDYSRPSMRGREIFGGIVPFGEVWRTGANAATQLITDRDLVIGDTNLPAGTYSLFRLPTDTSWTLIINKQNGQWGTQYDSAQDFARIPMTVTHTDQPVERFTVTVTPNGADGGTLAFEWAQMKGTVPFTVK
ncbi:MAG: DUF2911 domain-containing protein [Gemmatimonadota bacterium]